MDEKELHTMTSLGAPNREAEINFLCQIFTGFWVTNPELRMGQAFSILFPNGTDLFEVTDQETLEGLVRLIQSTQEQEQ